MGRYKDNGICDYLREKYKENDWKSGIRFYNIDKSLLIVASKRESQPLCLIIDDRVEPSQNPAYLSEDEKRYGNECFRIAHQAGLPLFWVRYIDCKILRNEDFVYLWHSKIGTGKFESVQLLSFISVFAQYGIEAKLENRTPEKRENDSLSSAFHMWQRECLKIGIFADMDLVRMHEGKVVELIELKRSYIRYDKWNPYNADINNFAILSNFCKMLGDVEFHVVFNSQLDRIPYEAKDRLIYYRKIQKKNNRVYYDKIDLLKIYRVERRENVYFYPLPYPVYIGTIDIENYLEYEKYIGFING